MLSKKLIHKLVVAGAFLLFSFFVADVCIQHSSVDEYYFISYVMLFQLEVVNKNLEAYYNAWDKFIQSWIVIKIKDPSCVFQWRLQVCYYKSM